MTSPVARPSNESRPNQDPNTKARRLVLIAALTALAAVAAGLIAILLPLASAEPPSLFPNQGLVVLYVSDPHVIASMDVTFVTDDALNMPCASGSEINVVVSFINPSSTLATQPPYTQPVLPANSPSYALL